MLATIDRDRSGDGNSAVVPRVPALVVSTVAAGGLLLQYAILVPSRGWFGAAFFCASFFTILTNACLAIVTGVPALAPGSRAGRRLAAPAIQAATVTYIVAVGVIYELILRRLWNPQGAQWMADFLLHTATPVLAFAHWLVFVRSGRLNYRDVPAWLAYPLGYAAVSLAAGPAREWYPYPFIDAAAIGYGRVAVNVVLLTLAFAALGAAIVLIDRRQRRASTSAG